MSVVYEYTFLKALFLTIIIESEVIFLLTKYLLKKELSNASIAVAGALPSFATLPYLWFVLPVFFIGHHTLFIIVGEFLVFILEALILYKLLDVKIQEAFLLSLVANLASYAFGLLL